MVLWPLLSLLKKIPVPGKMICMLSGALPAGSIYRCHLTSTEVSILNTRPSQDCLIYITGIVFILRWVLDKCGYHCEIVRNSLHKSLFINLIFPQVDIYFQLWWCHGKYITVSNLGITECIMNLAITLAFLLNLYLSKECVNFCLRNTLFCRCDGIRNMSLSTIS